LVPSSRRAAGIPNHRADLAGHTIAGKYRFLAILGEGAMGTVWEAEDIAHGRPVAVKVLDAGNATATRIERFYQEVQATKKIRHINICPVEDVGSLEDGSPFLVMERLIGETLAQRLAREGALPIEDVLDILNQMLSGVGAAHARGIVHRDIKPENVFLTPGVGSRALVKILDFGASKVLAETGDEELHLTGTGNVIGTPFYMSPEQARGEQNLDARVDLWACGVVMYEALTGQRPFVAKNYNALLLQIVTTNPRPAHELRPGLPRAVDPILRRAMATKRERRYASAALFQRDLASLRSQLGTEEGLSALLHWSVDELPTEIRSVPREETTGTAMTIAAPRKIPSPPHGVEDTVKIDGDLEQHFAQVHGTTPSSPSVTIRLSPDDLTRS
jgi:serine/threonine-protein kinase